MARAAVRGGGIEVDGLAETMRALRRFDKEVGKEAVDIFRTEAKAVQADAKAHARGAHPAAPSNTAWIGRSATGQGAGIKLKAHHGRGMGLAVEWGAHRWHIRAWPAEKTRGYIQSAMRRRTFRVHQGKGFDVKGSGGPGYVIQPAIRRALPGMEKRVADKLQALMVRELNKAGVPRGR
jgi:hypothetical protein